MPLNDEQLDRYARHIILKQVGGAGQQDLLAARVLVVGAGGLGSPLLMYLAAAGVGTLGIIDDDVVDLSNLQRQIIHSTSSVGCAKTDSAVETLRALNPDVKLISHTARLTADNAHDIISGYDLVADGCDNFDSRFIINDVCLAQKKPLVSAALSQFDGQVATFKGYEVDKPCYRCFIPDHPGTVGNCAEAGILGAVAGVVGSLQAVEVLKELLELGDSLAGKILLYDALNASSRTIRLPKDPGCPTCGKR
ncbi:HesA/MoeB/ThiF family protein [Paremcibacter congregatus]|uniref:Molybdopterin-synthase adenylyltransferase n=1 Tax=Paremcibacter congregatus TaxID=2043170 RepID=A0A2G4YPC0_9PROT|nr:molybdopterin-synthase adenylyltransferase MoeB [Paremcibacter congregatus]PHZ84179.1 adenylyltransferase [Paremcibacter congregatus]QDE29088.1 molybdopterin-synthase adenylyltransferase MoeB [Paremcibacter congregatus]